MAYSPSGFYATYFVQALGALLTAVVFHALYRSYGRGYLLAWTRSWLALSVFQVYAGITRAAGASWSPTHPATLALAAIASLAGWYQVAWLMLGTYELTMRRPLPATLRRPIFAAIGVVAVITGVLFTWDQDAPHRHYLLSTGPRSLAMAVAFIFAALAIWRRYGGRPGVGHHVVSAAFLAYGTLMGYQFADAVAGALRGNLIPFADLLSVVEFVIQVGLVIGLVIVLLERERQAADEAALAAAHLAYHDPLTGLPNRQLFLDRLVVAIANAHRHGQKLAVFFLDLDRFKVVNDSLGHAAGDELLRCVASRMKATLRENDTVARLGGDEFTILSPEITQGEDAITIAHKVRDAIENPIVIDGRELFVTTSLGISLYPDDGETPDALLRNADSALYRAKARGRDTFELYRPAMNARALEQLALESSMRRAVANGEFVLHYQPIVDLRSGAARGTEALLRWQHPEYGLLSPDHFIFLAEITGLVVPIGEWVLRTACAQTRAWQLAGHAGLHAAVNLSVRQLQQRDFVERVETALADTGLPPESLELEVTESIAMHSAEHGGDNTLGRLRALKRIGVQISIDDFGTGYSSLSVLRLLPVDTLKIDRSFVHGVGAPPGNGSAIAAAIIALAHSLGLSVVAEGVETPTQLDFLVGKRCDALQGFLAAQPAPADVCGELLARRTFLHPGTPPVAGAG
jgi:diguanylate cyclase (GGDEF)-like protein